MIINTGQRTDIPAFYAEWFARRLDEGFVCVRNPYNPRQVRRYRLDPSVVDAIGFCTKNPAPMLKYMDRLHPYGQLWFVTITPYGRDIEPNVPDKHGLLEVFRSLSGIVGVNSICWRYDPILLTGRYTAEYHLRAFAKMAEALEGATDTVVISFIDLYPKVRRNFPEAREVPAADRLALGRAIVEIAASHGMSVKTCAEGTELSAVGADCSGCALIADYERAIGKRLDAPRTAPGRAGCACHLSADIGAYDSCLHLCRYCYANSDTSAVIARSRIHDLGSPFLIGGPLPDDEVIDVPQKSWAVPPDTLLF